MPTCPTALQRLLIVALVLAGACTLMPCYAEPIGTSMEFSQKIKTGGHYMQVRLLGLLRLSNTPVDGLPANELSGMAWDEDEQLLYAISDKGHLVHLRPQFKDGILTGVDFLHAYPLLDEHGSRLKRGMTDAEDLAIRNANNGSRGDSELVISFEDVPRLVRYRPDGTWLGEEPLPELLRDQHNYEGRNAELEAVALHPQFGLLTAPQKPLKTESPGLMSLYAQSGRQWQFAPIDTEDSDIVSLAITPKNEVLILERRYKNFFTPIIFAVRRVRLEEQPGGGLLTVEDVARFSNTDGFRIDNFEGLAHHQGNRYFMVSDDNNSAIQQTLLLYFEIDGAQVNGK
jgi:hypothetical protein